MSACITTWTVNAKFYASLLNHREDDSQDFAVLYSIASLICRLENVMAFRKIHTLQDMCYVEAVTPKRRTILRNIFHTIYTLFTFSPISSRICRLIVVVMDLRSTLASVFTCALSSKLTV